MTQIIDLAEYILAKLGPMTATRLQKLIYYCQAWNLVWTESTLFTDKIEAWRNGPIVPALYEMYKGHWKVYANFFYEKHPEKLPLDLAQSEKDIVDCVLEFYGEKDTHWLEQLVHMEEPWKLAKPKCHNPDHIMSEITPCSISEYYCSL